MNKKTKHTSATLAAMGTISLFFLPDAIAYAQDLYQPLVTLPGLFKAGSSTNPVQIIKGVYGLAIGIGSVIATVMIIWAGFEYMYVESIGQKSKARERITNSFVGLLVILGSYILLRTINPDLVNFNIVLPGGSGNLQGLIAADKESQISAAATARLHIAADKMGNEIRRADSLLEDVEKLGVQRDIMLEMKEALWESGKTDEDPEIQELILDIDSIEKQIASKTTEAETIKTLARNEGSKALIAETANLSIGDMAKYNTDTVKERLARLVSIRDRALKNIDSASGLTPEQKAQEKSKILNLAGLEKVLLERVSDVNTILQSNSSGFFNPNLSSETVGALNGIKLSLASTRAKVNSSSSGVYADEAQKNLVTKKITETIQGLDELITIAKSNESEAAKKNKLKASVLLGPAAVGVCYFLCD